MNERSSRCVLVADDDTDVLELICEVLTGAGFQPMTATDGADVRPLALAHRPAVSVLDVLMPKMDGYTALTRLGGDRATRDIPVVMLVWRALGGERPCGGRGVTAGQCPPRSPSLTTSRTCGRSSGARPTRPPTARRGSRRSARAAAVAGRVA